MEASSNVLVDHHGLYPKRNNPSFPAFGSNGGNNNCLLRSASQPVILDVPGVSGVGGGTGFLGPCPSVSTYSSLPPSHLFQQPHPPLLPIPLKFSSLPSPISSASIQRTAGGATARSTNKDSKKTKSYPAKPQKDGQFGGMQPQKEPAAVTAPVRVPKSATAAAASPFEDERPPKDEDGLAGDVYSLSPPPSSLPMPRFSLRGRTSAETFGGGVLVGDGGADAGASDDLRRLLRL